MQIITSFYFMFLISIVNTARILGVFPTPSISHQVVFRPLMEELANRGHDVVVITADPAYSKGKSPSKLSEIDVHDIQYKVISDFSDTFTKYDNDLRKEHEYIFKLLTKFLEVLVQSEQVQNLIRDKNRTFDLVFTEACIRPTIVFSYLYQVPVIEFSSFGGYYGTLESVGAAIHPIIYPNGMSRKISNMTIWEKLNEIYNQYTINNIYNDNLEYENNMLKKIFGPEIPHINELKKSVQMVFLNVHPIWDFNRPIPPNVIYLGQMHLQKEREKQLPEDIVSFLNSSVHGVIYTSFGTNVKLSMLPPEKIKTLIKVFSEMHYEVLWKWDGEIPSNIPKNIKFSRWFPQSTLLKHPKIKLFITQGGLQSTDEALTAGVPLIAIPFLGDQWYNAELYAIHGIGKMLQWDDLNEKSLKDSISDVTGNSSYRENVIRLRQLMRDQPQSPLEKAVWWTEYVLRHKGAKHLMSPAAHLSWLEYYEVNLILFTLGVLLIFSIVTLIVFQSVFYQIKNILNFSKFKSD